MEKKLLRHIALFIYYVFLRHFPHSTTPVVGNLSEKLRYHCCKHIFARCGKNVNIGKGARFGTGFQIEIGDNSGIGMNCKVPDNIKIGNDVLMGVGVTIFSSNHSFERTDIPIKKQRYKKYSPVVIEDDVWIGTNSLIMPGRVIRRGTIIGAGTVLTKDYPHFSIVAGNPARLLRSRLEEVKTMHSYGSSPLAKVN